MMQKIPQFFAKHPLTGLAVSFFIIILVGAFLLKLPWATEGGMPFLDALFTATSAATVTGLIVKDTGGDFTLFGQIVILILIQLGILEIMGFASVFFLALRKKAAIAKGTFLKEGLGVEFRGEALKLLRFIFLSIFVIEFLGAIFLFLSWEQSIFSSLFHSVSAFANAGFSLFSDNLAGFQGSIIINFIFGILIFLGGIGFLTIREVKQKILASIKKEKARISAFSKIIISTSLILLVLGAGLFYFFEKENLSHLDADSLWLASFFQSVTARTAGFNTVEIGELASPTLLVLMFLMLVGGAPGSAAGGIKVISLALIIIFIVAFFQRKEEPTVLRRAVPFIFFKKVLVLVSVSLMIIVAGTLILLYTEKGPFDETLFEAISAFGTVGLSMGLTSGLSAAGKVVVIILMYLGRIAPLGMAIIGSRELIKSKVYYLKEKIYLG